MAFNNHEHKPDFSPQGIPKNGQGVRGGVAYRKLSDSYVNDKNYPHWFFAAVNTLLILFTLAVILLLIFAFASPVSLAEIGQDQVEISYTLEFYDINGALAAAPAVGTSLIDPATGAVLGEITAVYARPYEVSAIVWQEEWQALPSDAMPSSVQLPAQVVSVTVTTMADYREGFGYSQGGIRIAMGDSYTVSLAGTVSSGTCVDVRKGVS